MSGAARRRLRVLSTATAADAAVATVLAIAAALGGLSANGGGAPATIGGLVLAGAVVMRRRRPVVAVLAAALGAVAIGNAHGQPLDLSPIAFVLSYYSLGRRSAERGWGRVDALLLAAPIPLIATSQGTPSPGNPLIVDVVSVWAFFMVIPFVAGRVAGRRARLITALRVNADRLADEQRQRERQAATDERTRIARELHDVIAHSMSVMVIQAGAARRVAQRDPKAATAAMRAVEQCGRDALLDLRRMIGVLRRDEVDLTGDVAPGVAQLNRLADRASVAGMPARVLVEGEPRRLPPALDLVIYRVVQEALTNAIKHAGPAQARIVVTFETDALELEIVDTGEAAASEPIDTGGQGLIGMKERLTLYGGELHAGVRPGGGFRVHARVPLPDVAPA